MTPTRDRRGELYWARRAVEIARNKFDQITDDEPELLDAAVLELRAAELRLNALLRARKNARDVLA